MNVDKTFREMLHLGLSWSDCRPFAEKLAPLGPAAASASTSSALGDPSGSQERLARVKRGLTLAEVATMRTIRLKSSARPATYANNKRKRSSLAEDKKNIKMVGGNVYDFMLARTVALTSTILVIYGPIHTNFGDISVLTLTL